MDKKLKFLKKFLLINVGVFLVAAGFYYFMDPNNLAPGGVTGLSKVITHYVDIPLSYVLLVLNAVLFVVGLIFIGAEFGVLTVYSSVALSVFMRGMEIITPLSGPLTGDLFIETLIGSAITAVGLAIVFYQGTSTGGTDIIAKILNKYFGMDIGKGLLSADFVVTMCAVFTFGLGKGLYSIVGVFMLGYLIDVVIEGLEMNKKVEIISSKGSEIKSYIINVLDRGATVYRAEGAYTGDEREIITTVVGKKEFIKLRRFIKEIDDKSFIVTYKVHETVGEGFKAFE